MDVKDVRGYALSSPITPPQARPFHGGVRRLHKRDIVLVVVETADGREGFATAGASSSAMREYFQGESQATFADVVEGPIADALSGERIDDPADVPRLIDRADLPTRLRWQAISAVDIAYHDLRGKEAGAPVYELLADRRGTTPTPEMDLYASAGMYMDPDGYVEQATTLEECGFFGYKYRPGIGLDGDRHTVDRLVDAIDDMELMLDVHTWWKIREGYDHATVTELVNHAVRAGAYWIEEPVAPDDHDGYVSLAESGAPLAGGESEASPDSLIRLGRTGAVAFLQGDVRHHGGYTGCWAAVEFCRGGPTEFVPHNFGTWLGLVANAHLVAAAPDVELLEYPVFENDPLLNTDPDPGMYPFDLAFDIVEGCPAVKDGRLTLSDDPGLGLSVDTSVVDEYPFVEGPWTEFDYDATP